MAKDAGKGKKEVSKSKESQQKDSSKSKHKAEKRNPNILHVSDFKRSSDVPYFKAVVASCACGATYETGSILENIRVDICANCHPFFTGEKRILDAEGRVEQFRKRYAQVASVAKN